MKSLTKIHQEADERVSLRLEVLRLKDLAKDWLKLMLVDETNIECPDSFFGQRLQSIKLDDMVVHRDKCGIETGPCDCGAAKLARRIVDLLYREMVREQRKRGGQRNDEEE
jgi:hypothetical protein